MVEPVIRKLRDLGEIVSELLPASSTHLLGCLHGNNYRRVEDSVLLEHHEQIYGEHSHDFASVDLVRLPPRTTMSKGRHFIISNSDEFISEQIPPVHVMPDRDLSRHNTVDCQNCETIDVPSVLVARYGIQTWGHWLGEIFPRVLLTELQFPGQFQYVMPQDIFNQNSPRTVWNSIWECFTALGIQRSRIVRTFYHQDYLFKELYGVTPVFEDGVFHPDLTGAFRKAFQEPEIRLGRALSERKIALLRTESTGRNISNLNDVIQVLSRYEFEFVEIGKLPFRDQITLFSQSNVVAGVLASGLTGLIFSPPGVKLLSFAPLNYINRFFVPLIQQRGGKMYDLRGKITQQDGRSSVFSDFHIDGDDLRIAIDSLLA